MALAQEDLAQIETLVRQIINSTPEVKNANVRYELDLRERTIRVEEELKHQRELMNAGFLQMEKRFEQIDKRFEQVDKRFEQVNIHFETLQKSIDTRFEQVNKHFETMQTSIDKRFEQQHQEIMGLHHEIKLLMRWSFATLLAIGGLVVAVLRLTGS